MKIIVVNKYQLFLILFTFLFYGLKTYLLNGGGTTKIVSFKVSMKLVSVTDGSHTKGCRAYSGIADLDSSTLSLCLLCTFKE